MTSKQCIKVSNLRKNGYTDLNNWLSMENNIYVGRTGRIWVDKKIFHYTGSKWANPFKVNEKCTLDESLLKYIDYIVETGLIYDIDELKGKNLGCWCESKDCHASILKDVANGDFLQEFFD